ncbi:MAG TPA: hypothetical protein VMU59_15270 [Caulobacteraceae bacterium]|nr:hypothetical protein [Caulobacteraceae bacterium]
MKSLRLAGPVTVLTFAALALSACDKPIEAPYTTGTCYQVVFLDKDGKTAKFNVVSQGRPNLESCAASLEGMRIHFLQMGGDQTEIIGAYQGNFLFLNPYGVFTSPSLTSARYPALVRTGDGRLVVPGAVEQQTQGQ